ncbi:MAG: hypothetical protein EBT39_01900 [Sphingobacteriia bacterium]|jgi:hypothetical protein|nr:hypothetical protein [Candidatus Fonsibacter lacus]
MISNLKIHQIIYYLQFKIKKKMQTKVNIIADDMGNVIRQSSTNSEFGHVRLQQERVTFGNTGWVKKSVLSTLLHGKLEDLQSLGLENITSLPGKIVVKESLEPFNNTDPDRDYKYAGDTGIICCQDGQPIYRKTFYVSDNTAEDVLIAHTNGQDIKEANGGSSFNLANKSVKVDKATSAKSFGIDAIEEEVSSDEIETTESTEELDLVEEETFEL